ncbi:MAG TPA: CDP-glucose 4,6-dehydratase [Chitinophagaceae bacterium]|nr:CDP-glucose 4,6-dehydratase [Chitinophagaceae bacterium]
MRLGKFGNMNYCGLFEHTYKGKKVLLTGHTGFKGTWMLIWLHQLGAIIKGYALAPEEGNDFYTRIGGDSLCDSVIADIRDKDKLKAVINDFQPDFVFHLAAQPLVIRSYEEPLYTFDVNIMGTGYLLEAIRFLEKKCTIVVITTDKVYENRETGQAYKEDDKLGGYDPYSASKAGAEIVVSSYRNSFFNSSKYKIHQKAIASARAGNVIGGGDWSKNRIIPDIIRGIERGEDVIVRNPVSVRPWQFVLEPLGGYLLLGARLNDEPVKFADAWNFGPHTDDVMNVRQVVEQAISIYGKGKYVMPPIIGQPHEAGLLNLDIGKSVSELAWQPKLRTAGAIEYTIDWYKLSAPEYYNFTLGQIQKYANK